MIPLDPPLLASDFRCAECCSVNFPGPTAECSTQIDSLSHESACHFAGIVTQTRLDRYSLNEYSPAVSKFSKWVNEQPTQTRAGKILGRSQATMSRWIAAGEVPGDACPDISEKTGIKRKDLNARVYQ